MQGTRREPETFTCRTSLGSSEPHSGQRVRVGLGLAWVGLACFWGTSPCCTGPGAQKHTVS